jgi:hypothetical protein
VRRGGGGSFVADALFVLLRGGVFLLVHGLAAGNVLALWLLLFLHLHPTEFGSDGAGVLAALFFWHTFRSTGRRLDRLAEGPISDGAAWSLPRGVVRSVQVGILVALVMLPVALPLEVYVFGAGNDDYAALGISLLWCAMAALVIFAVGLSVSSPRTARQGRERSARFVPSASCFLVRFASILFEGIPLVHMAAYVPAMVIGALALPEQLHRWSGFGLFLALVLLALGMFVAFLRLGRFRGRSPVRMEVTPAALHVDDRRGRRHVVFWSNVRKAVEKTGPMAIFDYLELTLDAKIVHLREEGLTPMQWRDLKQGVRDRVTEAGGRVRISI